MADNTTENARWKMLKAMPHSPLKVGHKCSLWLNVSSSTARWEDLLRAGADFSHFYKKVALIAAKTALNPASCRAATRAGALNGHSGPAAGEATRMRRRWPLTWSAAGRMLSSLKKLVRRGAFP